MLQEEGSPSASVALSPTVGSFSEVIDLEAPLLPQSSHNRFARNMWTLQFVDPALEQENFNSYLTDGIMRSNRMALLTRVLTTLSASIILWGYLEPKVGHAPGVISFMMATNTLPLLGALLLSYSAWGRRYFQAAVVFAVAYLMLWCSAILWNERFLVEWALLMLQSKYQHPMMPIQHPELREDFLHACAGFITLIFVEMYWANCWVFLCFGCHIRFYQSATLAVPSACLFFVIWHKAVVYMLLLFTFNSSFGMFFGISALLVVVNHFYCWVGLYRSESINAENFALRINMTDRASSLQYQLALEKEKKLRLDAEAQQQAAEAQVAAEQNVVAYLCHEIRNPLSAMAWFVERMSDEGACSLLGKMGADDTIDSTASNSKARANVGKGKAKASGEGEQRGGSSAHLGLTATHTTNDLARSDRSRLACHRCAHEQSEWRQDALLSGMKQRSRYVIKLLDDLLDLSKLESGTVSLQREPVHLDRLCDNVLQILEPMKGAGVRFVNGVDASMKHVWIASDEVRLQQLLINLVSNACKCTVRGEIRVRMRLVGAGPITAVAATATTSPSNGNGRQETRGSHPAQGQARELVLEVCDTGCGVDESEAHKIFTKYASISRKFSAASSHDAATHNSALERQGGASVREGMKSTGLGLVIARSVAALLGSQDIEVASPWVDRDPPTEHLSGGMDDLEEEEEEGAQRGAKFSLRFPVEVLDSYPQQSQSVDRSTVVQPVSEMAFVTGGDGDDGTGNISLTRTLTASNTPATSATASTFSVLICEDDAMNIVIMAQLVESIRLADGKKLRAVGVPTAEAALAELKHRDKLQQLEPQQSRQPSRQSGSGYDLLIMDMHLETAGGVLLGTEAIAQIRRQEAKAAAAQAGGVVSRLPAIICSGNCTEQDRKLYAAAGADLMWCKPYPSMEQMSKDLRELLAMRV